MKLFFSERTRRLYYMVDSETQALFYSTYDDSWLSHYFVKSETLIPFCVEIHLELLKDADRKSFIEDFI